MQRKFHNLTQEFDKAQYRCFRNDIALLSIITISKIIQLLNLMKGFNKR